ncbi:hypothetical protein [Ureibacillus chungkukjangi]|uniref:Uncharacterized protein n=1 Tax=Ureibacillus chungkukjangi TaxID=1202712 RepID=A0A318TTR0_9BACL|nr:hypothetical protein [Ureibacillus chungkukjangi]PYF08236.1 hypothetical protein BJ095_1021 [Ureibacillus chungkukjangi]
MITTKQLFEILKVLKIKNKNMSHLSQKELKELIIKYYDSNLKILDIKRAYDITKIVGKFNKELPELISTISCTNCEIPYTVIWESRTNHQGHVLNCPKCKNKRYSLIDEKLDISMLAKQELQNDIIGEEKNPLTLRDFVALSAILKLCFDYQRMRIYNLEFFIEKIFPNKGYGEFIINELKMKGILIKDDERGDSYNNEQSYILSSVFSPKYDYESSLYSLLNYSKFLVEQKDFHVFEKMSLWHELALQEVFQYYFFSLKKIGYKAYITTTNHSTFKYLLRQFSIAQIWGIISKAISFTGERLKDKVTFEKFDEKICINCEQFANRAITQNWELANYNRPYEMPISVMSNIFFNDIIQVSNNNGFNKKLNIEFLK